MLLFSTSFKETLSSRLIALNDKEFEQIGCIESDDNLGLSFTLLPLKVIFGEINLVFIKEKHMM